MKETDGLKFTGKQWAATSGRLMAQHRTAMKRTETSWTVGVCFEALPQIGDVVEGVIKVINEVLVSQMCLTVVGPEKSQKMRTDHQRLAKSDFHFPPQRKIMGSPARLWSVGSGARFRLKVREVEQLPPERFLEVRELVSAQSSSRFPEGFAVLWSRRKFVCRSSFKGRFCGTLQEVIVPAFRSGS